MIGWVLFGGLLALSWVLAWHGLSVEETCAAVAVCPLPTPSPLLGLTLIGSLIWLGLLGLAVVRNRSLAKTLLGFEEGRG